MKPQSFPWPDDGREARESVARVRLRSLKESFEHLCSHPLITFFVWLLIGIALSLPAGFWLVQHNIGVVAQELSTDSGFTVYFYKDLPQEEVETAANSLRRNPIVKDVDVITAQEAWEFLMASDFDEELDALDSNPLPASLTVTATQETDREQILELAKWASEQPAVESVEVDTEWMVQLHQIRQIASRLTWILSALYGIGVVFVSVAAVRYAMDSRFEELRVISLLGASNRSMRRPFVYCGVLYGFGGGVVATCIVVLSLMIIEQPLQGLANRYGGSIQFLAMDYLFSFILIVVGSILGLVGALQVTVVQIRKNRYSNRSR
ncbi:MAG: ABC transporter permease [Gammaproteobacteria bacterium]|nr:ABC transporter permease [Gammaproteobacteria bacterium]